VCAKQGQEDVNKLRYEIIVKEVKKSNLINCQPARTAFCNTQKEQIAAALWRRILSHDPEPLDPTQSG
jgi:hypothetical protein